MQVILFSSPIELPAEDGWGWDEEGWDEEGWDPEQDWEAAWDEIEDRLTR